MLIVFPMVNIFLNPKEFELDKNEFSTTLHGGSQSCHNAPWKIENYDDDFVELSYQFNDGDMGFGGSLSVKVRYELDGAKLKIIIEARTPQISLCNFTNHSYFNLDYSGNLKNHYLWLNLMKLLRSIIINYPLEDY